ncbi:asparagine synthase (glutamine-hydrolyzing) [Azospirillum sp. TSO5]|uniref:asparagine synthase (glutamine-hydrolyzing) n=1 Tax=Azospirillum sp. TSO5 TaxID=716760 RepID=UPI000D61394E|nr:asparagine synthase (glutamine-hydrolyzing) [Azospirillum sp. TSO5]PWC97440.1 hypothetical protein TSO5_05420 [Azospirillum sp. TSO5]
MCGIAGILALASGAPPVDEADLQRMCDVMAARGPDGQGLWLSSDRTLGLGHRRLAVIDPGPASDQPMATPDGRLRIVFNGEIYNHRELRAGLESEGVEFRTRSDTEVLLHLYDRHGPAMVERLSGMFAFALWDERRRGVLLARDPFGIKPLYIAQDGNCLRFASQVKALAGRQRESRQSGGLTGGLDAAALAGFLTFGFVPEPLTLHRGIRSLPAGSSLWVDGTGSRPPLRYFCPREILLAARETPLPVSERRDRLRDALLASVRRHLVSDVPVGLFLSAGADSGALLALAAEAGGMGAPAPRCLTLAFDAFLGTGADESGPAGQVAALYGGPHAVHTVHTGDFQAARSSLLAAMDQPSTDGVNSWLISRMARAEGIKVALSGVGGDELLGGYPSFRQIPRLTAALAPLRRLPALGRVLRHCAAPLLRPPLLRHVASPKYAGLLEYGTTVEDAYLLRRAVYMPWELPALIDPDVARDGWRELAAPERLAALTTGIADPYQRVLLLETGWYMRNQLLRDSDWAGMAHGVEIRTPLVDADLFRALAPLLAAGQPPGKGDLLAAARPPLPDAVARRPKTGFNVPMAQWLERSSHRETAPPPRRPSRHGPREWALAILRDLPETRAVAGAVAGAVAA